MDHMKVVLQAMSRTRVHIRALKSYTAHHGEINETRPLDAQGSDKVRVRTGEMMC